MTNEHQIATGQALRRLRDAAGLSVFEMCEAIGQSDTRTYRRWEQAEFLRGKSERATLYYLANPSPETAQSAIDNWHKGDGE